MWYRFVDDTSGGVATSETILIGTILILGMVVALVEVQCAMIAEINDISEAAGGISQSYQQSGLHGSKPVNIAKSRTFGASYRDQQDTSDCDSNLSVICADSGEIRK
jgi:hypothetical protein